jgi:hypothetical protein
MAWRMLNAPTNGDTEGWSSNCEGQMTAPFNIGLTSVILRAESIFG